MVTSQPEARPALSAFYEIAGRVLSVNSFDEESARAADRFISCWFVAPIADATDPEVDCTLRVRRGAAPAVPVGRTRFEVPAGYCYTDGETYYFAVDGAVTIVHPPAARLIEVWADEAAGAEPFSVALAALLRRSGLCELHGAGVVEPESGAGVLITGPSGSGKSTLALRLIQSGWKYLSDDVILLNEEVAFIEARGFRRAFSLSEAALAACEPPHLEAAALAPSEADPDKRRLDPQAMFPLSRAEATVPKALFFPVITNRPTSHVVRLTQAEALTQLIRMCPWACYDAPVAPQHLRVLSRLARQSVGYRLHSGRDLLEQPGFASEFLAFHLRKPR